jgi:hypothetical protein
MRGSKWCPVLVAVAATCFPTSGSDDNDLLAPFLHGTVFTMAAEKWESSSWIRR